MGNATKYTARGEITVSARMQADRIEMSVEDTGKGIPRDELSFERFRTETGDCEENFPSLSRSVMGGKQS